MFFSLPRKVSWPYLSSSKFLFWKAHLKYLSLAFLTLSHLTKVITALPMSVPPALLHSPIPALRAVYSCAWRSGTVHSPQQDHVSSISPWCPPHSAYLVTFTKHGNERTNKPDLPIYTAVLHPAHQKMTPEKQIWRPPVLLYRLHATSMLNTVSIITAWLSQMQISQGFLKQAQKAFVLRKMEDEGSWWRQVTFWSASFQIPQVKMTVLM